MSDQQQQHYGNDRTAPLLARLRRHRDNLIRDYTERTCRDCADDAPDDWPVSMYQPLATVQASITAIESAIQESQQREE